MGTRAKTAMSFRYGALPNENVNRYGSSSRTRGWKGQQQREREEERKISDVKLRQTSVRNLYSSILKRDVLMATKTGRRNIMLIAAIECVRNAVLTRPDDVLTTI